MVAAGVSMLSTPVPARPTTLRLVAAESRSLVTFVAERTTRAVVLCLCEWGAGVSKGQRHWDGEREEGGRGGRGCIAGSKAKKAGKVNASTFQHA